MLEVVVAVLGIVVIAQAAIIIRTHERLWRVAMSRTPGEYRAAEKDAKRKPDAPKPQSLVELDEDMALVLQAVTEGNPMPHGLGGA